MTYNVYSIKDAKTGFANPYIDVNDDSAARGFALAYANSNPLLSFAPADFSLYCIGKFDSVSGHLTEVLPRFVCDASSFKKGVDSLEK